MTRRDRAWSDAGAAAVLAGPAAVGLLVLFLLPAVSVLVIALTDWEFGARSLHFVGADNFAAVFEDEGFRAALFNTVLYVVLVVPATLVLGLVVALLIESGESARAFYRAVHFLPFMATLAAMAVAWESLLDPTIGLVNHLLSVLGFSPRNWLRDEATVLPVLAAIGIWQNLGFAMVLFMAGLKSIPRDLYDAADIDGADGWLSRLSAVTLPMLGPVALFTTVAIAVRALEVFDTVQILTQGGPGHASDVLLLVLYRESFEFLHVGYGAAISIVFLAIALAFMAVQSRAMGRKVHYQ
jgi:multiple sugar transport system permease protein